MNSAAVSSAATAAILASRNGREISDETMAIVLIVFGLIFILFSYKLPIFDKFGKRVSPKINFFRILGLIALVIGFFYVLEIMLRIK